jgi:hypothetical protein
MDCLLRSNDPRLRQAIIPLLLTYPDQAHALQHVIARLPAALAERAKYLYVVAAAAQRMWRSRLQWTLGPQPLIPVAYDRELGIPDIDAEHGQAALLRVAKKEEEHYGYNALAGYRALIEQILAEIEVGNWGAAHARTSEPPAHRPTP